MRAEDHIVWPQVRANTGGNRLLTDIRVTSTVNQAALV
jgi:hypothetical protein